MGQGGGKAAQHGQAQPGGGVQPTHGGGGLQRLVGGAGARHRAGRQVDGLGGGMGWRRGKRGAGRRLGRAARQAQQAWAEYWDIGCSLAELNRDRLRGQWQAQKQKRAPAADRRATRD